MPLTITPTQVDNLLKQAADLAKSAKTQASNSSLGTTIKNGLYSYSDKIQAILNGVFAKGGVITQQEIDAIDEQSRLAKKALLDAKSKQTQRKIIIYTSMAIVLIGGILIVKNKTK